jgi:hypothetical protein
MADPSTFDRNPYPEDDRHGARDGALGVGPFGPSFEDFRLARSRFFSRLHAETTLNTLEAAWSVPALGEHDPGGRTHSTET